MPRVVAIYGAGRNRAARGEMNSPFSLRENARLRMGWRLAKAAAFSRSI